MPLYVAAKRVGVEPRTLMKWMEEELGLQFPVVGKGSRHIVNVADVNAAVQKHMPTKVW